VYRRGSDRGRVRSTGTRNLPPGSGAAQRRILELIEGELLAVVAPPSKSGTVVPRHSASA
jgi:hypothetical protein